LITSSEKPNDADRHDDRPVPSANRPSTAISAPPADVTAQPRRGCCTSQSRVAVVVSANGSLPGKD